MNIKKYFDNLFIFEMANNHMGDVDHGLKIYKTDRRIALARKCGLKTIEEIGKEKRFYQRKIFE